MSKDRPVSAATSVYNEQVAELIATSPRDSTYKPARPRALTLAHRHALGALDDLEPEERRQLEAFFSAEQLPGFLAEEESCAEAAHVVDEAGALCYRLYGWNYGGGLLMPASGIDLVAYAAQHDMEHWSLAQRELFYAMDAALRAPGHCFEQPLEFCWWREGCWAEIADEAPGTLGSESSLRKWMGLA